MSTTFAALIYRPDEIPDRALSQGFAVALGGWDVSAPRLLVAEIPGLHGYAAAFYRSSANPGDDELDHLCELFEDELSPPVAVLDAAAELGRPSARVFALIFAEDIVHDDGWRFDQSGFERHFVREGEDGLESGIETPDESDITPLPIDLPKDASEDEERAAIERATRPHRGSTFLSAELRAPVLAALMGAYFTTERRIDIRLIEPGPASIRHEVERLNRVLGRSAGRGAFAAPRVISGVTAPASYDAFVASYDWTDPKDPQDLYRELSIGAIEGTLRFLREDEVQARATDPGWASAAKQGLYPIAKLVASALGAAGGKEITIALAADGDGLWCVQAGHKATLAGPTFGELLRYLSLGWSRRSDAEEDVIGALMLKARLRTEVQP